MLDPVQHPTARPATAEDQPLLFALFCAGRQRTFATLGFAPQQLQPLFAMQFRARQIDYAQRFAAATDTILCLADGTPVGRHLVERQPGGYRGIDLAILPAFQNRGIGTWALRQTQTLAKAEGTTFCLRVLRDNPALRLYERSGFIRIASDKIAHEMEWSPLPHIAIAAMGAQLRAQLEEVCCAR